MGLYGVKPLALGVRRTPADSRASSRADDLNVPDVQQRVHWDPEWARRAGNPTTYDYGRMRETWLIHLCTDWMGDDAWLWKLDCEFRAFNYVGDTHWIRGTVIRKLPRRRRPACGRPRPRGDQPARRVNTTPGTATILLPSREFGPVRLPDPPGADLESALTTTSDACQPTLNTSHHWWRHARSGGGSRWSTMNRYPDSSASSTPAARTTLTTHNAGRAAGAQHVVRCLPDVVVRGVRAVAEGTREAPRDR